MKKDEILKKFDNEIEQKKESASYLFYGDSRVNLIEYALIFASKVMGINNESKIINILNNPDVELINKENKNIKIEEIREIILQSTESPYIYSKKIFILNGIEKLRKVSSNALLKIIEEPPSNVYFILLTRSLNIIPTIKSRTVKFHLEALSSNELNVSQETYNFFEGKEIFINEWLKYSYKTNKKLEDYKVENNINIIFLHLVEAKKYINLDFYYQENGQEEDTIIEKIIYFYKSIEFIAKKIKVLTIIDYYKLINKIETEYKEDRNYISFLLHNLIISSKDIISPVKLRALISLKNSINNNVNLKMILFNFFEILRS